MNDGEWIEEVYNGMETVPRNYDNADSRQIDKPQVPLDLQTPSRTETDLNNNEFLIYNNISGFIFGGSNGACSFG